MSVSPITSARSSRRPPAAPPTSELLGASVGLRAASMPTLEGRLTEVVGLVLEARGCRASIGDLYEILPVDGSASIQAEVVALRDERTLLMALEEVSSGMAVGARVRRIGRGARVPVGDALLGRVLDGLGRPIDARPAPRTTETRALYAAPPSPLARRPIEEPLDVGVRAIDGTLTLGRGQRMGIFAGGGVGKSTLLAMMVQQASVDVAVIALVG